MGIALVAFWWLFVRRGMLRVFALVAAAATGFLVLTLIVDYVVASRAPIGRLRTLVGAFSEGLDRLRDVCDGLAEGFLKLVPPRGTGKLGYAVVITLAALLAFVPPVIVTASPRSGLARDIYPAYAKWRDLERGSGVRFSQRVSLLPVTPSPIVHWRNRRLYIVSGPVFGGRSFVLRGPVSETRRVGGIVARGTLRASGAMSLDRMHVRAHKLSKGKRYRLTIAASSFVVRLQ